MSAHFYTITLRGSNLQPHDTEEIRKVLNRGQNDWLYEQDDIFQRKDEIIITAEAKGVLYHPIFKAVSKYLKDVESVLIYCEPYWNMIRSEGCDLDFVIWARNKDERQRLWYDARISCMSFEPSRNAQKEIYEEYLKLQCEENKVHFYEPAEREMMDRLAEEDPNYEYPDDYDPDMYETGLEYPYSSDFQIKIADALIDKFRNAECKMFFITSKLPKNA